MLNWIETCDITQQNSFSSLCNVLFCSVCLMTACKSCLITAPCACVLWIATELHTLHFLHADLNQSENRYAFTPSTPPNPPSPYPITTLGHSQTVLDLSLPPSPSFSIPSHFCLSHAHYCFIRWLFHVSVWTGLWKQISQKHMLYVQL